ncbi:hypothetical protein BHE74_00012158 [Ensete ventricosum]|nr:hypothetical protein GW17_00026959 [Ensete ventricosum]RWW79551.1 hypothetical protein BHE74_00012158 [Ensete ventricosum]RZR77822.1 hypothetical protein BHM03_00003021 [Ensete ventricosum]
MHRSTMMMKLGEHEIAHIDCSAAGKKGDACELEHGEGGERGGVREEETSKSKKLVG